VKRVLLVCICALETNPYFVFYSSLELELICAKDANNGAKALGCARFYFVVLCVDANVCGDGHDL